MDYDKPKAEIIDFEKDFVLSAGPAPWNPEYGSHDKDEKIPNTPGYIYSDM